MTNILIMGDSVQGLVAAGLLAKVGHKVRIARFESDEKDKGFYVSHLPYALPTRIMEDLNLEHHGFNPISHVDNPFKKLPFYDGLLALVAMFKNLEKNRPEYKEKAWRDAWNTFEIGRILAGYSLDIQELFARSASVSLFELLDVVHLEDNDKANIIAMCILGSKTDPSLPGSAFSIIPALTAFEEENAVLVQGNLSLLIRALKLSAMVSGVDFIEDSIIQKVNCEGDIIESVTLDNQDRVTADYFLLDDDPIRIFIQFMSEVNLPPAFRNRISPGQHMKESVGMRIVLSGAEISKSIQLIAPTTDYIKIAKSEVKAEGGSQFPILSVVGTPLENGQFLLDIWAQYFEKDALDNSDAVSKAIIQALEKYYPHIQEKISDSMIEPLDALTGQPSIIGSMPLLQLFKIFSGYHSVGYDTPIENMFIVGYGISSLSHPHVSDGGARVASLLQSL